jgi:hypothetical protein
MRTLTKENEEERCGFNKWWCLLQAAQTIGRRQNADDDSDDGDEEMEHNKRENLRNDDSEDDSEDEAETSTEANMADAKFGSFWLAIFAGTAAGR